MYIWRKSILFYLGGCAYFGLELLWRGESYGSMFLAGGLSFVLIGGLNEVEPKLPLPLRAIFGAGIITAVELLFGLLVNRDYSVWDYRMQPGNLWGQICPAFCLVWVVLAAAALGIFPLLEKAIRRRTAPPAKNA